MSLTIIDVCERLDISYSTAKRWLRTGRLKGTKRHPCGGVCAAPATCQHGAWEIEAAELNGVHRARRRAL